MGSLPLDRGTSLFIGTLPMFGATRTQLGDALSSSTPNQSAQPGRGIGGATIDADDEAPPMGGGDTARNFLGGGVLQAEVSEPESAPAHSSS